MSEWEKHYKHAERHFRDHSATLIQDTDRFTIIDWRNKNGSGNYYINFIVDKKRGSLIVSGDLGDSIATWYNPIKVSDIKQYIFKDIEYYMSKFQCTSDDFIYDDDFAFECLIDRLFGSEDDRDENIERYIETSYYESFDDFKDDVYDEVRNSIRSNGRKGDIFIPTDHLYEIASSVCEDAWEFIYDLGAQIDARVYLWAIAFNMACSQLGF